MAAIDNDIQEIIIMTRYYILVGIAEGESDYSYIFGDYQRSVVMDEKDACKHEYRKLKVVACLDSQQSVDDALLLCWYY